MTENPLKHLSTALTLNAIKAHRDSFKLDVFPHDEPKAESEQNFDAFDMAVLKAFNRLEGKPTEQPKTVIKTASVKRLSFEAAVKKLYSEIY